MYKFTPVLPPVSRDPADFDKFQNSEILGLDLEWSKYEKPTVLGISDGTLSVSVPFEDGVDYLRDLLKTKHRWVGHNFISADQLVLSRMGINIPLEDIEDTILWMWLVNAHLAKSSGKTALEEDAGEKRGRGFFNLGTMLSVYTDIWHYKSCRGGSCSGPCPEHAKFDYNGIDSLGPVLALPALKRQAQLRGVDKLYPMHRELAYVLAQMQEYGVRVDVPYIYPRSVHPLGSTTGQSLNELFLKEKAEIETTLPFNPKSPKQVMEYFKTIRIEIDNAQEETIRELVDDLGDSAPDELVNLLDYKELGNGVDRWFEPQYRDQDGWLQGYLDSNGFCHPRLNFFTSSARLACSSPNFQNIAKRRKSRKVCECNCPLKNHTIRRIEIVKGREKEFFACTSCSCQERTPMSIGKKIRRAIIAPEGWYIVRADYSNAENRVVLHQSGYTIPRNVDLHEEVAEMAGITEKMEISKLLGSVRDAAKSIQHANNILEGLQLKLPVDLYKPKFKAEVAAGARIVHPNWTFQKKVVSFTGANLARRIYGDASWEHRKAALEISEKYFARFPGVREFQKRTSAQNEREGAVRTPLGYCTLSFGDAEDRMKTGQGITQQQPVAHVTKLALLNIWKRWKRDGLMRCVLQVHDEVICYVKDSVHPETAKEWLRQDLEIEMPEFPGLIIPADPSYGKSWADQST